MELDQTIDRVRKIRAVQKLDRSWIAVPLTEEKEEEARKDGEIEE